MEGHPGDQSGNRHDQQEQVPRMNHCKERGNIEELQHLDTSVVITLTELKYSAMISQSQS